MGILLERFHAQLSRVRWGCKSADTDSILRNDMRRIVEEGYEKGDYAGTFDAIISLYAIFHIPREEQEDLFLKMAGLLKENGKILITLGTSGSYGEEESWCGAKMAWSTYDPDTYKKLLDNKGFEILEATFEGRPGDEEYHFWVLAAKN